MSIPDYYKPKEHYPLSGIAHGTQTRLIQPRHHQDPPYALELEVWEEGLKQGSILYAAMYKKEPVLFKYPRIDGINIYNRGYLPVRIRDMYSLHDSDVTIVQPYLEANILKPDASVYYKITWKNAATMVARVALRLHKPFDDITIELHRRA